MPHIARMPSPELLDSWVPHPPPPLTRLNMKRAAVGVSKYRWVVGPTLTAGVRRNKWVEPEPILWGKLVRKGHQKAAICRTWAWYVVPSDASEVFQFFKDCAAMGLRKAVKRHDTTHFL